MGVIDLVVGCDADGLETRRGGGILQASSSTILFGEFRLETSSNLKVACEDAMLQFWSVNLESH